MATVSCDPCKTAGSTQHTPKEAEFLATVHDRRAHGGGKTATTTR